MEALDDRIKRFLAVSYGYGYDVDDGYGYGSGSGYGYGYGSDDGSGYGSGDGYGSGYGSGYGYGYGYGYDVDVDDGDGSGYGYGYGYGYDSGDNVKEVNGQKVYIIDEVQTVITSVRDNVAHGAILNSDLTLTPCYIVKENNNFAHGETLHEAFTALQEKLYDGSTEEERIAAFVEKFPEYDTLYDNRDLLIYHHVLTGSCKMGRENFVKGKGLTLDGKTTIREFVELTKDAYGGYVIRKLPTKYGD